MSARYCECRIPLIPARGYRIRPTVNCPLHKILAERWDDIHSMEDYMAAIAADSERIRQEYFPSEGKVSTSQEKLEQRAGMARLDVDKPIQTQPLWVLWVFGLKR